MISRRERLRTATVAEIKDHARQLLVAGGPSAISLRAIAREMGMTAPAIYRYFPSLDALVVELTEDLYAELTEAVQAVRDPNDPPLEQLIAMARAFRRWSLAHPAEFGLMFGNPVPGVARFEGDRRGVRVPRNEERGRTGAEEKCLTPEHAGARFGQPFLSALTDLYWMGDLPGPPVEVLETHLGHHLAPLGERAQTDLPLPVVHAYLSAWTRLYGLVAMEVFGHLRWAMDDMTPLFDVELAAFVDQIRVVR